MDEEVLFLFFGKIEIVKVKFICDLNKCEMFVWFVLLFNYMLVCL